MLISILALISSVDCSAPVVKTADIYAVLDTATVPVLLQLRDQAHDVIDAHAECPEARELEDLAFAVAELAENRHKAGAR